MQRWSSAVLARETTADMLLVHTVAIALYLCIGLVLLRALVLLRRTGERPAGFLAIAVLILTASLTRAVWLGMFWLGLQPLPWLDLAVVSFVYASAMSTPIIVSAFHLPASKRTQRGHLPVHLWLHWALIGNAAVGAFLLLIAAVHSSRALILEGLSAIYAAAATLLWARVGSLHNLEIRRRGVLLFAAFTSAGLVTVSAIFAYGWIDHVQVRRSPITTTALEFSSLLIVIGALFVFANLRLADIIVKRVLRVALWVCAALAVWSGIAVLAHGLPAQMDLRSRAFNDLLELALIALFGVATPACGRMLDLWIDRWLFQQPDFDAAIKMLWQRLVRYENTSEVFQDAAEFTRSTLSLSAVEVSPFSEAGASGTPAVADLAPAFLQRLSRRGQRTSAQADILMPLFLEGSPAYFFVLRRGIMRPPLTAMELAFVERVAAQLQVRLETMLAESRRMDDLRRDTAFREELTEAELRALRAQINPHFLFNSLNTIADLTLTAPERAEQMTLRLSAVFRYVLVNTERQFSSLREELSFARSYLEIEEFRFGDRLRTFFDVDPEVLEERVPTLLLQPLIENALRHGLAPLRSGGTIRIVARSTKDGITVIVADDGVGLQRSDPGASPAGTHVGLCNVRRRLLTAYQGLASLQLNPREGGGAEAIVVIERSLGKR